ncbi:MAG: hypothetical protein IPP70_05085 [Elusimicrobia bacterium]|nr:hypothetical protein [Elusimicrobiota bacterium]
MESAAPIAADAVVWRHYGDALAQQGRRDAARRVAGKPIWPIPRIREPVSVWVPAWSPDDVTDLSGPRVLLKRAERNFRGMNVLSGVAGVAGRAGTVFRCAGPRCSITPAPTDSVSNCWGRRSRRKWF